MKNTLKLITLTLVALASVPVMGTQDLKLLQSFAKKIGIHNEKVVKGNLTGQLEIPGILNGEASLVTYKDGAALRINNATLGDVKNHLLQSYISGNIGPRQLQQGDPRFPVDIEFGSNVPNYITERVRQGLEQQVTSIADSVETEKSPNQALAAARIETVKKITQQVRNSFNISSLQYKSTWQKFASGALSGVQCQTEIMGKSLHFAFDLDVHNPQKGFQSLVNQIVDKMVDETKSIIKASNKK